MIMLKDNDNLTSVWVKNGERGGICNGPTFIVTDRDYIVNDTHSKT